MSKFASIVTVHPVASRKRETKSEFRARVGELVGEKYSNIPIADRDEAVFEGPIFAKRNNVYVVGAAWGYDVSEDGNKEYHSFVRVIL